ncbi:MAG TPA: branched-chain amino acid ABC transporter permease, partial [Burkholderiaceae bacterium]|nr:branched-chain amino acid ABC transporter permease [Burkholderiaceae bacterium]
NLVTAGTVTIPVTLIPLVGGVAGMGFGVLFGYVTTKKSGTTFSMITLGLVELVAASSLMFPGFFGGEGGISTNRVIGNPILGISYGPQIQVYYLIAFWLFVSTIGMYAFTHTPLGRIANAVRDNPERVEFVGYDTQWVRYLTLILSAFFAGISGGLSAINFEIVTAENVGALRSGLVLLYTFIGGISFFFGPMIGAVIGVFLTVMLSDYTKAWQFYLGVFFIVIVMYSPGGVASILMSHVRLIKFQKFTRVWHRLGPLCGAALVALSGVVMMIEMMYHRALDADNGPVMKLIVWDVDTGAVVPWVIAIVLLAMGSFGVRLTKPGFQSVWSDVNSEIETAMRKGDA